MMASFSAFGSDFPSIALIVLHSLEGSDLWSSVSMNCLRCSFVVLVISSFICCIAGELGSLDLRSSRALIFSNMSARTGSVLRGCRPEDRWYARSFLLFGSWMEAVFCPAVLHLLTISVPVGLLKDEAGTIMYRVDSEVHPKTKEDW